MPYLSIISSFFQFRNISVEIDHRLLPKIKTQDKTTTNRIISIKLYSLILYIGTIQSRRFQPSNRMKLIDKSDLLEKIYTGDDFKVKINEIRHLNGSETLKSISEDLGVGISVVIVESLFDIKSSTITKIKGTGKRPDWQCQTKSDEIIIVECKSAISATTSTTQQSNALLQKNQLSGDIKIASLTILNENDISNNRLIDPPIGREAKSPIMENHILRARHYASTFSLLGSSEKVGD